MSDLPPLTSLLPPDDRRLQYCYLGRRIFSPGVPFEPLWMRDSERSRPMLVLGSTGYGKSEFLISLAYGDACKGRPVIFLDGKCDRTTRDRLYYYCHRKAGRPFYCLLPFQHGDRDSHSWNPLLSASLPVSTIGECLFNAYFDPGGPHKGGGEVFYYDLQRDIFFHLLRALHSCGFAFNTRDVKYLLERDELLQELSRVLRPSGMLAYGDLMRTKSELGSRCRDVLLRFLAYLDWFEHWSLNSYNPSIQFDRLIPAGAVIYIGLPLGSEPQRMAAIGNIVLNQLKALSAQVQNQTETTRRRTVSCILDDGASFIDTGLAEWICKVRSSGFLLTLGIQTIASLEGRRPGFGDEIRSNAPNVFMYNPKDDKTAKWFSALARSEPHKVFTASVKESEEGGSGTVRTAERPRIHPDAVLALPPGQCYFSPPVLIDRPPLLATPYLCPPSNHPEAVYVRPCQPGSQDFRGLNLSVKMEDFSRTLGAAVSSRK